MATENLKSRRFASVAELERANFELARIQEWAGLNFQDKLAKVLDLSAAHVNTRLKDAKLDKNGNFKIDALNQAMVLNVASDMARILDEAGYSELAQEHVATYGALFDQARKVWARSGVPFDFDQGQIESLQAIADADLSFFGRLTPLAVAGVEKALTESVLVGANFQVAANAIEKALASAGSSFVRHAFTYANDSLHNFSAAMSAIRDQKYNPEYYYYAGTIIKTSREFCRQRAGKVWPAKEVKSWEALDWAGKKPGPIKIVRGGWNCKHSLIAVTKTWAAANGLTVETEPAPKPPAPRRRKPPGLEGADFLPDATMRSILRTWKGPRTGLIIPPAGKEKPPPPVEPKPEPKKPAPAKKPAAPKAKAISPATKWKDFRVRLEGLGYPIEDIDKLWYAYEKGELKTWPGPKAAAKPKPVPKPKSKAGRFTWADLDNEDKPMFDGTSNKPGAHSWVRTPGGMKVAWSETDRVPAANGTEPFLLRKPPGIKHKVKYVKAAVDRVERLLEGLEGVKGFEDLKKGFEIVFLKYKHPKGSAGFMYAAHPKRAFVSGNNDPGLAQTRRAEVTRLAERLLKRGEITRERYAEIVNGAARLNHEEVMAGTIAHELGHCWHSKRLGNWHTQTWEQIQNLDGPAWKNYLKSAKQRYGGEHGKFEKAVVEIVADDFRLIVFGEEYARSVRPNYRCMRNDMINPDAAAASREQLMKALGLKRPAPPAAPEPTPELEGPLRRLRTTVTLSKPQIDTIEYAASGGKISAQDKQDLMRAGNLTSEEFDNLVTRLREETQLVINRRLRPDSQSYRDLLETGVMKNQFVVEAEGKQATSGGAVAPWKGGPRDVWERKLSGGNLQKNPDYERAETSKPLPMNVAQERPIYGYLNDPLRPYLNNDYGGISFVLKRDAKARATFSINNSSLMDDNRAAAGELFTIDTLKGLVRQVIDKAPEHLGDPNAVKNMAQGKADLQGWSGWGYTESQVYGGIDLRRDVEKIFINSRDRETWKHIQVLADKYGIEVEWND